MTQSRRIGLYITVVASAALVAGCTRDPNARKHEFFNSGVRYYAKAEYREAAIQFTNAVRIDPKYEQAHYQLARCDMKLGLWNNVYQELSRAVELRPDDLKAQIDLGNLLLAGRQFKRAQAQAKLVMQKDPKNVDAIVLMANADAGLSNFEDSLGEMQNAIQLAPSRPQTYLNMGALQLDAKKVNDAEASFKKAVQLDPKSASAVMALGNFYVRERRWADAEQQFQRAIDLAPQSPLPRAALARLYIFEGKQSLAGQTLEAAKKAMPSNPAAYQMLAQYYFASGQMDKALAEYAALLKAHPADVVVQKSYAQLLVLDHDYTQAAKIDGEILKKNSKDPGGLILQGEIDEGQNKPNDAINILQEVLNTEPDNASAHYYLAVAFNLTGQLDRAEGEWRQAARLRPNMVEAQRALAAVAIRKNDADLLKESAGQLIHLLPNSPEGYVLRAKAEASQKNGEAAAETDLNKAIQVAPQSPLGYGNLANLRFSQKRYSEAQRLYEESLAKSPGFTPALQGLVNIDLVEKRPQQAIQRVNEQIAKVPDSSAYYLLLARTYAASHDLSKCETAAAEAVRLDKNNIEAYLLLGQVQQALGSQDAAISTYEQASQMSPKDIRPYFVLATLDDQMGNWEKAQGLYQKILQLEPDYPPAENNLAYLMIEHHQNLDVALSMAQAARRAMPESPAAADTLGSAYFHKGLYQLAVGLFQDAAQRDPKDPDIHYHLGLTYEKLGDQARAKAEFDRALGLNPKFKDADKARQELAGLHNG